MMQRLCAIAILFPLLLSTACQRDAFRFQITFPEAPYIKEGAQVRYLGIEVGKVEKVTFNSETSGALPQVIVSVAIKDKNVHIRQGDKFAVETAGLLGDAFVSIRPGPTSAPAAVPGATLKGEASSASFRTFVDFLNTTGINAGLHALPQEKREALIESFNKMIFAVLEEERQKSNGAHQPPKKKR